MTSNEVSPTFDAIKPKEKIPRERWNSKVEFILSVVGLCVGLGNVWRFPYLCYKYGGGVFLIPYVVALFVSGIPMLFMELSLGQMFKIGGLGVWKMCPLFKGVGYAAAIMAFWLSIYYIVILAYALYFLTYTFTTVKLAWSRCDQLWNTKCCQLTCTPNITSTLLLNKTCSSCVTPTEEFWKNKVLQISSGVDDVGNIRTPLLICLFIIWTMCYFCIWKGVKWTGKIVYFTATFPYIILTILLIRGVTLPGAQNGIKFYLKPDISKLWDPEVWMAATTQIFFSYGLGLGTHIALGSYNPTNNNCQRDSMIIALVNAGTSFFSGFAIFSTLGYMAHQQGVHVKDVVTSGYGLAFVAYPSVVSTMTGPHFFAGCFFLMIIILGLDSQFCTLEGIITAIMDEWPDFLKKRREVFVLVFCFISLIIGISTITEGGYYVFQLFDNYSASGYALLFLMFFECISFSWSFGATRLVKEIEEMIDEKLYFWWKICWVFLCPCLCFVIFVLSMIDFKRISVGEYQYPLVYEILIGGTLCFSSIIFIPGFMMYYISKRFQSNSGEYTKVILWDIIRPNLPMNKVSTEDMYTISATNRNGYNNEAIED